MAQENPGVQGANDDRPAVLHMLPIGHAVNDDKPVVLQNEPIGHGE